MIKVGYDALMHEVCVVWGFCGCIKHGQRLHVDLLIPPEGPVSADQFVDWVFLADNLNPYSAPQRWQRQKAAMHDAFVKHLGAETVDARMLRWSDIPSTDDELDEKFRGYLADET